MTDSNGNICKYWQYWKNLENYLSVPDDPWEICQTEFKKTWNDSIFNNIHIRLKNKRNLITFENIYNWLLKQNYFKYQTSIKICKNVMYSNCFSNCK